MKTLPAFRPSLHLPSLALVVLALLPGIIAPKEVLTGWLAFSVLTSTIVLGGFFFVMLVDVIPGGWGQVVRPAAAELSCWMPLLALSVLLVLVGARAIFPWFDGKGLEGFRAYYLSPASFSARTALIMLLLLLLNRKLLPRPNRALAISALIVFMPVQNLLATDLVLSLDPEFHSSGFGLYLLSLQALTGFCAIIWLRLGRRPSGAGEIAILGALLLVMLLCWAYFDFMQYFILWSGNLPSRAAWFARRSAGVWHLLSAIQVWLRLVPTFLLLFPPFRQGRKWLLLFAAVSMIGTVMEIAWLVLPELDDYGWASFAYLTSCAAALLLAYRTSRMPPPLSTLAAEKTQ